MRLNRPSREELIEDFEEELASVSTGGGLRSETGMDADTDAALWAIARAYPDVTPELVSAARKAFAGQLDGSNADRRRAELAAQVEGMRRARDGR